MPSTCPWVLWQFINDLGAGGPHIPGRMPFLCDSFSGVSGHRGWPGRNWVGCSWRREFNRGHSCYYCAKMLCRSPMGQDVGQVSASGPVAQAAGGPLGWGESQDPCQAVLTPLLCFSPGARHLQSRQSVPGTHDQHPVGADAHQSVHALGH